MSKYIVCYTIYISEEFTTGFGITKDRDKAGEYTMDEAVDLRNSVARYIHGSFPRVERSGDALDWHPVEVQPTVEPDRLTQFLIHTEQGHIFEGLYRPPKGDTPGQWLMEYDDGSNNQLHPIAITHWRPFPAPPLILEDKSNE